MLDNITLTQFDNLEGRNMRVKGRRMASNTFVTYFNL